MTGELFKEYDLECLQAKRMIVYDAANQTRHKIRNIMHQHDI